MNVKKTHVSPNFAKLPAMKNENIKHNDLRKKAEQNSEMGAITSTYSGDRQEVIRLLNRALATELICALRYKHDYYMAGGSLGKIAREEFIEHAKQEEAHADRIAERIRQLGGEPNFDPDTLTEIADMPYEKNICLPDMIHGNLIAERIAIDAYRMIANFVTPFDSTTRNLMEWVLKEEEEHADDMANLLCDIVTADEKTEAA